jgi:hypothetical protein
MNYNKKSNWRINIIFYFSGEIIQYWYANRTKTEALRLALRHRDIAKAVIYYLDDGEIRINIEIDEMSDEDMQAHYSRKEKKS